MPEPKSTDRVIVDGRPTSQNYGKSFWSIDLPGGGFISLYADRPVVNAGCLEFWGRHYPPKDGGAVPDRDQSKSEEFLLFALPAGRWTAFYAASVFDGSAIAVDRWTERGKPV